MQTTADTPPAPPLVLITRPRPGAERFAAAVRARYGARLRVLCAPVMDIVRTGAVPDLAGVRTLVFTSPNGVQCYLAGTDRRDIPCYAVGDATAETASAAGMQATSAQGAAEDLLALMIDEGVQGPVLHLRGAHAAADVAGALRGRGIEACDAVLYAQQPRALSDAARKALRGCDPVILPVFSPRSARLALAEGVPRCPLVPVAISDAAAAALPGGLGEGAIRAARPDGAAMLDALNAALAAVKRLEGTRGWH